MSATSIICGLAACELELLDEDAAGLCWAAGTRAATEDEGPELWRVGCACCGKGS